MEQLIQAFLAALSAVGITAVRQQPQLTLPLLSAPVTAVGLAGAKGEEQAFFEYLGELEQEGGTVSLYGRRLEAEISLTVYCPKKLGGQRCRQEADSICQLLSGSLNGIRFAGFSVEPCRYEPESDLFRCGITVQARAYLYALPNEDETEFTDFILKGAAK